MNKTKFSVNDMVVVGIMAAIIFTLTYFIRIPITTPAGPTMIKVANAFILLAGILFGGLRGGLAAGIGSMIFDLLDPAYISSAPFTLVFFFLMAYICGKISHMNGSKGDKLSLNILGAIAGSLAYYILNIGKSIIMLVLAGSSFQAALAACTMKFISSGINVVIAVVISVILAPMLKKALTKVNLYNKISI